MCSFRWIVRRGYYLRLDPRMTDRLIECIRHHLSDNGFPPSITELATCLGVSRATVHAQLVEAEEAGLIKRQPGRPRALRIIDAD